jgi:peptide/nickel transport system permease protein
LLGAWWWFLPPGLCIAILGAALTFVNFGIDEIANPRLRRESETSKTRMSKAEKRRGAAG